MLYEIMKKCNNFFVEESYKGHWVIEGGKIALPFIKNNQYFLIHGSTFNDGVYQSTDTLVDEEFNGVISPLAIPKSFLALVSRIEEWQEQYSEKVTSPYTSESFGGYSYTKATGTNGSSVSWQDVFKTDLSVWRKV